MIKKESDNNVGQNDFTECVQLYYQDLQKLNPIPKEEERQLLIKAKNGDIEARNKILNSNLKFVFTIAKKYRGRGVDISDLINEGNDGMMHAIDVFDLNQDVKFFSYAVWWIRQRMIVAIKNHQEECDKQMCFDDVFGEKETNYDNIYYDEDDDAYGNDVADELDNNIEKIETENQKKCVVEKLLVRLDERERLVIEKYFGINNNDNEETLREISRDLNICTERVRQIKAQALSKLREEVFDIKEAEFLFV